MTLDSVAEVVSTTGPSEIHRADQVRVAVVSANLRDIDLGGAVQEVRDMVAAHPLGADIGMHIGGQGEELSDSVKSLLFAFGLAIFLVYLVMASQFESLLHPFVILFTIPLALVGAVLALFLTGSTVSVVVFIGLILLVGIVVKNAIILIDKVNQLREQGVAKREALVEGARSRLRPIVMTTLCTLFGFLPLAIAIGEGAEVRSPMAITVIGGLLVSTLLTLVVIPVVYDLLDRRADEYYRERGRRARRDSRTWPPASPATGATDRCGPGMTRRRCHAPERTRMSIAELSIKRPVTTVMLFVSLFVIGLIAAVRLPLEAFPSVTPPLIFVQSALHRLDAGGSRTHVAAAGRRGDVDDVRHQAHRRHRARERRRPDVVIFTDWSRNVAIAASEARERIDAIRDELPDDLQRYFVQKIDTGDQPVLRVRLASDTQNLTGAYDLIDREFKRRIERLPGVAKVEVSGAPPNEVEIAIAPDRLTAHDISLNDLTKTPAGGRISRCPPARSTTAGSACACSRSANSPTCSQLTDLVIGTTGVRLGDIADVRLKPARMDYGRRLDGRPAVGLDIFKERDANLVEVSAQRAARKSRRSARSPRCSGIQVKVIDNQGDNVTSSLTQPRRSRRHRPGAVDRGAVLLPAPLAVDADGDAGDPDLLRDDAGLHVLRRRHAQHPVDDGPAAGGRHAGRQRGRGRRKHLPGTREESRAAAAGVDPRHAPCRHRAVGRHAVPLHRVRAEPVRRTQFPRASTCRRSRSRFRSRCWRRGWSRSA